jgi:hypothetical protein
MIKGSRKTVLPLLREGNRRSGQKGTLNNQSSAHLLRYNQKIILRQSGERDVEISNIPEMDGIFDISTFTKFFSKNTKNNF